MKPKYILSFFALFISNQTLAQTPMPSNFSLSCHDGTFAYNILQTKVENDHLNIDVSGFEFDRWIDLVVPEETRTDKSSSSSFLANIKIPLKSCSSSHNDSKIFRCYSESLELTLVNRFSKDRDNSILKFKVEGGEIQLRRVTELSMYGTDVMGYELRIVGHARKPQPALTVKYFNGIGGFGGHFADETNKCRFE